MADKNNTPVPNGGDEVFAGTDPTVDTPVISQIGNPGPPTSTAVAGTAANPGLEQYLATNWITVATFIWTVGLAPGTLMWSCPISPDIHPILAYLSALYNSWAGPLEFLVKVAGTAFHAGALKIVRLPPNIPPETYNTAQDTDYFEWGVIDPKTLEVVARSVADQRRMNYHYVGDKTPDGIGGHLAIYVQIPLNTSASGTHQIQINVWCRTGPGFTFLQVKPIPRNPSERPDRWRRMGDMFRFADQHTTTTYDRQSIIYNLIILQKSTKMIDRGMAMHRDGFGELRSSKYPYDYTTLSRDDDKVWPPFPDFVTTDGTEFASKGYVWNWTGEGRAYFKVNPVAENQKGRLMMSNKNAEALAKPGNAITFAEIADDKVSMIPETSNASNTWPCTGRIVVPFADIYGDWNPIKNSDSADNFAAPNEFESIVVFPSNKTPVEEFLTKQMWSTQTAYMSEYMLLNKPFTEIGQHQAVIFQAVDTQYNLPVGTFKLYPSGFLTSVASSTNKVIRLNKIVLNPIQLIPIGQPIPVVPGSEAYAKNLDLLDTYRELKRWRAWRQQVEPQLDL